MGEHTADELTKADQVAAQCRVVVHLCEVMIDLYRMHGDLFGQHVAGHLPLVDMLGTRTAALMEELGDHLNGIDAVSDEDEWVNEVYRVAHEMFPLAAST